jgi:uncharacterized protein YggE
MKSDKQIDVALRTAAEAAGNTAAQVLEAHGFKLGGVLIIAEIPTTSTETVSTASWLHVRTQSAFPYVAETLRHVVERLEAQKPVLSKPRKELN